MEGKVPAAARGQTICAFRQVYRHKKQNACIRTIPHILTTFLLVCSRFRLDKAEALWIEIFFSRRNYLLEADLA